MLHKVLAFIFLLQISSGLMYAQSIDMPLLDSMLNSLNNNKKAMGSLAISKNGELLYSRAIGYSAYSDSLKVLATGETKYRIGSITKMFTAVIIFQLIEEGKINLNTTIDSFFPSLSNVKGITIGELLAHRSGLHNFTDDTAFKDWKGQHKSRQDMLDMIASNGSDFEPGTKAAYSNTNYLLLGYIAEGICGKTYTELLKQRVLSRVGLINTCYGGLTNIAHGESHSYRGGTDWHSEPEADLSTLDGAGALLSTPADLDIFITALFAGKLVSINSLLQMANIKDGYGMGLLPFTFHGRKAYGYVGSIDGNSAVLEYFPDDSLAIAYCANAVVYPRNDIVIAALSFYYHLPFDIPSFHTITLQSADLDKYLGVYASKQLRVKITVTKDKKTLMAQTTGQTPFPLDATGKDRFEFFTSGILMQFKPEQNKLTFTQHGASYLFSKEAR